MDKPSYKLVGAPCGHHGQYTFYKALRLTGPNERILAIGDFFFVRIWQDSELVSIGELQLLWTDRVSDQTLVSLRLYFLPENTPDGRSLHGEDEVLAINDKVVVRAEDLLTWVSSGQDWTYGLKAVWRGACAPPNDERHTSPLHRTKLDFSDVEREKSTIVVDTESPGVVVFSYPRYCRYRALLSRLEGIQAHWLRDSLVAALGGYAAPTSNTRILYCKDTFEYPELEGHEYVCNHLAPKLKGRPRGRRRRVPRSRTHSPESHSSEEDSAATHVQPEHTSPRRLSLRNGLDKLRSDSDPHAADRDPNVTDEDKTFLKHLRHFYRDSDVCFSQALSLKHLSLRSLYTRVTSRGGYELVSRHKLWRHLFADQTTFTRRHYERYLLPFENHERRNSLRNGTIDPFATMDCDFKMAIKDKIDIIDVADSPPRDLTPAVKHVDCETGEIKEEHITSKHAEELNREFLDSLPKEEKCMKITVKPVEKLIEPGLDGLMDKDGFNELASKLHIGNADTRFLKEMTRSNTHLPTLNGHIEHLNNRPVGRSSLRAVRVKPTRQLNVSQDNSQVPSRPESTSTSPPTVSTTPSTSAPPVTNFGIHRPHTRQEEEDDDEIVEVPYKPKTPEIIDLDEYPESPQSVKKKKLDILKERGLEVTPLPAPWPPLTTPIITPNPLFLNPIQHQLMSNQLYQMYNNNLPFQPPKVVQATPLFGTSSPEKIVYGNPKDPFMPPPHILHGIPIKPIKIQQPTAPPQDILDLTCKLTKPAVEIVRVPTTPSPSKSQPQNLTKNYSIIDGKAVVGSNLEITLVNKAQSPSPQKKPQKRSSNGKFTKTPTPPKEYPKPYKKQPINVPNYQIREDSPTSSNSSQNSQKEPPKVVKEPPKGPLNSFLDPYMALYSLAGQMDPRQLAAYREIMANQFRYSGLLNMGVGNPTTKN